MTENKSHRASEISFIENILGNYDLLCLILRNLKMMEIIPIINTNNFYTKFFKNSEHSQKLIKHCLKYDFGEILQCEHFQLASNKPDVLIQQLYKNKESFFAIYDMS